MPGKHNAGGCGCCKKPQPCARCSGAVPYRIRVDIAGAVNDNCSDCADYNTTIWLAPTSSCNWTFTGPGPCGTTDVWTLSLTDTGADIEVKLTLTVSGSEKSAWTYTFASVNSINCCEDLDGLELTYDSMAAWIECDFSSSTATLGAVCASELPACAGCIDDLYPEELEVTLSGVTGGPADCSEINATFVVPRSTCIYSGSYAGIGPDPPLGILVTIGAGSIRVDVIILLSGAVFLETHTGDIDCLTLDMDIPYSSNTSSCTFSSATCHVRAV